MASSSFVVSVLLVMEALNKSMNVLTRIVAIEPCKL